MKKGKVLFIIHDVYQEDNEFPIGVGYLASMLQNYGAEVSICCQDLYHYSNEELADKFLKNQEYDLIGMGFMAARFEETIVDLCSTVNRYKKKAKVILGGHGPSPIPEYILRRTKADLVAIGEAEETIVEVLDSIVKNRGFRDIKGIAYRDSEGIHINEARPPVKEIDTIPFPAWDLFPMDIYTTNMQYMRQDKNEKAFQIVTSRGCVNQCTFCYRMHKGIRFRSIQNVIEEIKTLKEKYGVTYFVMQDELFVASIKRLKEFTDALNKEQLTIKYFCGGIRANTINEEMLQLLKDSGCCYINVGFESVNQNILDELKKRTTVEDNYKAAELIKKYDIAIGINFIWGSWNDDEQTLQDSVDFIKKYNTYDEVRTIRPITPYPGCEMYYDAIAEGLLSGPKDFFEKFSNSDLLTVNLTNMSNDKFYELLYNANKELILDHYKECDEMRNKAHQMIDNFYNLYFKGFTKFRGARHFDKKK
jgi:anaerobic magnesium-protoporphyrin IX monomethyl ester cyclase